MLQPQIIVGPCRMVALNHKPPGSGGRFGARGRRWFGRPREVALFFVFSEGHGDSNAVLPGFSRRFGFWRRRFFGRRPIEFSMQPQCFGDLFANRVNRIQRRHRILKDHPYLRAS